MGGTAFIVEEQIEQLISRGLKIIDEAKAKETLLDIGYYRLGFYWYYFQDSKSHKFMYDISLDDIVKLYYFDFDIKHLLSKYIYRIEVHFRTQIIYYVSNHYKNNNQWYIDPAIINKGILKEFNNIYYTLKTKNNILSKHHTKYPNKSYAPAWKVFEFLTFGQIFKFYRNLKNEDLKIKIANVYGFRDFEMLENFFLAIINIRNVCSHHAVLYDYNQPTKIWKIPNKYYRGTSRNRNNLMASLRLILFILSKISINRSEELEQKLKDIFNDFEACDSIKNVIKEKINFDL